VISNFYQYRILVNIKTAFNKSIRINSKLIKDAQLLRHLIIDAETGQRGYIITGNIEFLDPYYKANNKFKIVFSSIKSQITNNQKLLQLLEKIWHLKLRWEGQAGSPEITLRKEITSSNNNLKKIDSLIVNGPGEKILAQIKIIILRLESELNILNVEGYFLIISKLSESIHTSVSGQKTFLLCGKTNYLESFYIGQEKFQNNYDLLKQRFKNSKKLLLLLSNIKIKYQDWIDQAAIPEIEVRIKHETDPRSFDDLSNLLGEGKGKGIIDELREISSTFIKQVEIEIEQDLIHSEKAVNNSILYLLYFILSSALICFLFTAFLSKSIFNSISLLLEGTRIISSGNLNHKIIINSKDEFENLAQSFNLMSHKIKQTQTQLIESSKMASLGKMASGIAHELNQPLGAISINSESIVKLLKRDHTEQAADLCQLNIEQIKRVTLIINALRAFSRESSKDQKEFYQVNDLINNMLLLFENDFRLNEIEIIKEFEVNLPKISLLKIQFEQVISNLLINAKDALENISKKKAIIIKTVLIDHLLIISFIDNGCGIPEKDILNIFDPFFTTKPIGKGTGLGLSLSYGMIESNDGTIKVTSEVGKGSTFLIEFPIKRNK